MIPENIFKSYDIRGIYPQEINEDNIVQIVQAIYAFLKQGNDTQTPLNVVLARDMRISSPSLYDLAKQSLVESGAQVIDLGLASTPTFYFAVNYYGYTAGLMITASHNPKEYNGIKVVKNSPYGIIKIGKSTGMEEIKRLALAGQKVKSQTQGQVIEKNDVLEAEIENALKIADRPAIRSFRVVADAANAMGALYIEALFKKIPGSLIKMNFKLDGTFPAHPADPLDPKNLVDLQKKVVSEKADLGLAPDGDGDRLFFVDEKGEIVPPSLITALVAKELLKKNPGEKILFDIRYIFNAQEAVKRFGGEPVITKVGHAFITEKLEEVQGLFAGESSAHYFFRATGNAESQLPVILIILKILSEERRPFSEILKEMQVSYESGEINFKVENAPMIIEEIKKRYQEGEISTLDGVAINFGDLRFSLRASNTEPLLRLNVEGYDQQKMLKLKEELVAFISQYSHGE